jgi:hypothetical protein
VGGSGQSQSLTQSAPTVQSAVANATSIQSDVTNVSSLGRPAVQTALSTATAVASNVNAATQIADELQVGGTDDIGQIQVIEQSAPTIQTAAAEAASTWVETTDAGGWVPATRAVVSAVTAIIGNARAIVESARAIQVGASTGTQVIVQTGASKQTATARTRTGRTHASATATASSSWSEVGLQAWWDGKSLGAVGSTRSAPQTGTSKPHRDTLPPENRPPFQHDPTGLGAASGTGSGGGTSFWFFGLLLLPFALAIPWGIRRQRSSAVRRLMSVVLRPERPG